MDREQAARAAHFRALATGVEDYLHGLARLLDAGQDVWVGLHEPDGREVVDRWYARQAAPAAWWTYTLSDDIHVATDEADAGDVHALRDVLEMVGAAAFRLTERGHRIRAFALYAVPRRGLPLVTLRPLEPPLLLDSSTNLTLEHYTVDLGWVRSWSLTQRGLALGDSAGGELPEGGA
jgi:hypothetical protein